MEGKHKTKIIVATISAIAVVLAGGSVGFSAINNNNNSLVVNINGEEVSVDKSNTEDLQNEINNLEEQKKSLENDNISLKETNSKLTMEIEKSINADLKSVKLVVDGVDAGINSTDSVAVINNKYYYSSDFVNGLIDNKDLSLDEDNKTVYLGDKKYESAKLLDVCPTPVVSDDYKVKLLTESINMSSEAYYEGFSMVSYGDNEYAVFNVKGNYKNLNFLVGHIDGTNMVSGILKIYISDENGKFTKTPVKTISVNPDELPQEINVELNFAKQIKFELSVKNFDSCNLGLVNLKLD